MILIAAACLLATDGDSIRNVCTGERYRIVRIDAPETGPCKPQGRICASGDGQASKRALASFLRGTVHVQRCGQDRYKRTLARVTVNRRDASDYMLAGGWAVARYGLPRACR